jgi:hypothetical protein
MRHRHSPRRSFARTLLTAAVALTLSACHDSVTGSRETVETALSATVLRVVFDGSYSTAGYSGRDMSALITRAGVRPGSDGTPSSPTYRLVKTSGTFAMAAAAPDPEGGAVFDFGPMCLLDAGSYAIVDPGTDRMVGMLIVYPDCSTEIVPVVKG